MARSIGGRSYSTTFFVFVSESICSLLNRLAQRAQSNSGQNASAPVRAAGLQARPCREST
jgi:hypothetical protein